MRSTFRPISTILFALLLAFLVPFASFTGAGPGPMPGEDATKKPDKSGIPPGAVEVRFTDNSSLKLALEDERIELSTPYGKLQIPVTEIQRIEFATRIPEEALKRIESAVGALASSEYSQRESAMTELLKHGERAYPALLAAAQSKDPEVVRRVDKLLDRVRSEVPEELLAFRKNDVVYTADSKITGQIEGSALKAQTYQFGGVRLKLADVRALRSLTAEPEHAELAALPNPGTLTAYQHQFSKEFRFTVTGTNDNGGLWGSDVYTLDSSLAKAAVHAGVLRAGQTGPVKVRIVASPPGFVGSTRHGIASANYGPYAAGAFQILK
ncbi:MAG TPA: LCCL domain-containing protein [Gemmataceae bacterium]|nr:LCCL domain-containing protein [Gemmataceae bacterium]